VNIRPKQHLRIGSNAAIEKFHLVTFLFYNSLKLDFFGFRIEWNCFGLSKSRVEKKHYD